MAYLPDETGYVKKRVLLRKGLMGDHLDELSAIVRGENTRDIMAPVRGWRRPIISQPVLEPERRGGGRPQKNLDREAMEALWASNAPLWAIAKAFGVSRNTIYVRARAWGLSKRGRRAKGRRRGTVKTAPKHGGL